MRWIWLEPSPITPTGVGDPFQVLAGTIKATLESAEGYNASGVVVAPQLVLGNTGMCRGGLDGCVMLMTVLICADTRYYWALTKNIFRYKHLGETDRFNGAHTINEGESAMVQSSRCLDRGVLTG